MKPFKIFAFGLLVALVLFASTIIYLLGSKDSEASTKVEFSVQSGESSPTIARKLSEQGLVRNSFAFYLYLKLIGGKILPGIYELSPAQSGSEIAELLASGKLKVAKVTIIEGWRVTQMEKYFVEEKKLSGLAGFATKAVDFEGYLFPDTYEVKLTVTVDEMIKLMRDTFNDKTKELRVTPETVILASIVEREAKTETERPQIAGVYVNRINNNIKLEADPTVQYAKGDWAAVSLSDYRSVISPYNTYLNEGWPPGPICSPGLSSLKAAANPTTHNYFYFFHAKGETLFSKTLAEHQAKVRQYF